MKIKSSFKDYYDYVAHMYGGGDPKIFYMREKITDTRHAIQGRVNWCAHIPIGIPFSEFSWLVVNGAIYTLLSIVDPVTGIRRAPKFFTRENFEDYVREVKPSRYYFNYYKSDNCWQQGVKSSAATLLSRRLNQPVFIVKSFVVDYKNNTSTFEVDSKIPILCDYGFHKYFNPEQLYQEIAYYISNQMHESPDLVVHDNMSDTEKVVQHGFDLKSSFRHRGR